MYKDLINEKTPQKRKKRWITNRQSAFNGSIQHFIQSLIEGTTTQQGFVVRQMKRTPLEQIYKERTKEIDTLLIEANDLQYLYQQLLTKGDGKSDLIKQSIKQSADRFVQELKAWNENANTATTKKMRFFEGITNGMPQATIYEFEKDRNWPGKIIAHSYPLDGELEKTARNGMISVLNRLPISPETLLMPNLQDSSRLLSFTDFIQITYRHEKEELNYLKRNLTGNTEPGVQTSVISLYQEPYVQIYPNGHIEPPYGLFVEEYWS